MITIPANTQVRLYCCAVNASNLDLLTLGLCWGLALVLPHFQTVPSAWELLGDFVIIGALSVSTFRLLSSPLAHSKPIKIVVGLITFGGFGLGVLLTKIWDSSIYEIWSHLGAGTMKIKGEVFIFGDLAHLTSAASCSMPIIISTNICDPWGRAYNQNPDIGNIFRVLHLTDSYLVGIITTLVFIVLFAVAIRFFQIQNLSSYLIILSPVFILALDRGNEIITVSLILIGVIGHQSNMSRHQLLGSIALLSAVFFKLWPIFLVFFLLIFQRRTIKISSRLVLLFPFIYLAFKFEEFQAIVEATQSGSPFGTSFGLSLFANSQISTLQLSILVLATWVVVFVLICLGKRNFENFVASEAGGRNMPSILSLMLTYSAIWATGDHFIYRMIVLVPLVFILASREVVAFYWARIIITSILVASITSRLPITIALTSGLAFYFCFLGIKVWLMRAKATRENSSHPNYL